MDEKQFSDFSDASDGMVELLVGLKNKLVNAGFSEQAAETLVIGWANRFMWNK